MDNEASHLLLMNIIFVLGAITTEKIGLSIPLYYYDPNWSTVWSIPIVVIET